jgi:hypothetical protein
VPVHPTHPDPEELAAWQAGDLPGPGGADVEAHVAGCAHCAGLVAAVARGRAALAGLAEVEAPVGLHERLAAAIEREATAPTMAGTTGGSDGHRAAAATDGDGPGESSPVAAPIPLDARRRGRRSPARRRRIAVLSTAAAVILLVVGLVPLLRHGGGSTLATQGGGSASAARPPSEGAGGPLPVLSAPQGYSKSALQSSLTHDATARNAYQAAASGVAATTRSGQPEPAKPVPQSDTQRSGGPTSGENEKSSGAVVGGGPTAGLQQLTCVAVAQNRARDQGLQPAFFVDTVYRGRPATVLVMVRPDTPDQAELWAFPRDNCSAGPFANDRVKVTPP